MASVMVLNISVEQYSCIGCELCQLPYSNSNKAYCNIFLINNILYQLFIMYVIINVV